MKEALSSQFYTRAQPDGNFTNASRGRNTDENWISAWQREENKLLERDYYNILQPIHIKGEMSNTRNIFDHVQNIEINEK